MASVPEPPELDPPGERLRLVGGRGHVVLRETGFLHPRSRWGGGDVFTPYADVTHIQVGARTLRLGTRQGVWILPRRLFADPEGPMRLARALLARIAAAPGGAVQLARLAEAEALWRRPARVRACGAAVLLCAAVFALGAYFGPVVHHAGFMNPLLVARGEPWRLATANLLHGGPLHLAANALGLLALGALVERPLGSARTLVVLGLSGLAANATSWLAGYDVLVGASGMVAGLAGAMLWLELRRPECLPAAWRIPRRPFLAVIALDALLPLVLPIVAGWAHAGGFAAGAAAASLVTGPRLVRQPPAPGLRLGAALVVTLAALSVASAGRFLVGSAVWEGHAARLLAAPPASPLLLNDAAWLIATSRAPTDEALADALDLARRAVDATDRRDPNLLDTLAEAQFRSGDARRALDTIDEAIALAPAEPYFREQRRRFVGERDPDDLPAPPSEPWGRERDPWPESPAFEEPGIPI